MELPGWLSDLTGLEFFGIVVLGNTVLAWVVFALTLVIVIGVLTLLKRLLLRRLLSLAKRTRSNADDAIIELLTRTRGLIILFIALSIAVRTLNLSDRAEAFAARVGYAALFIQFGIWGAGLITYFTNRYIAKREGAEADTAMTIRAASFLARIVLWTLILLLTLQNVFAVNITALITGLGIGGIAIALAVQNVLGDLFGAVSIVLDKPFVVGDFIIVDSYLGTVEYVGLKTTRVRSLSGEQIVFSNGDLLSSRIRNYKRMFQRRIVFTVTVPYDTPREKAEAIPRWIRAIVESEEEVQFDRSHLATFGESGFVFETVYMVKKPDYNVYMDIQQRINFALMRRLEEEGIGFAVPARAIRVSGAIDGPGVPVGR